MVKNIDKEIAQAEEKLRKLKEEKEANEGIELKPCPFCGGSASIFEYDKFFVECGRCSCALGMEAGNHPDDGFQGSFSSKKEAANAWNKRAQ